MFFLNSNFVHIKVNVMLIISSMWIFWTNSKNCYNSSNGGYIWTCMEHVNTSNFCRLNKIFEVFSSPVRAWNFQAFLATTLVAFNASRVIDFKTNNSNNNNIVLVIVKVVVMTIIWRWRQLSLVVMITIINCKPVHHRNFPRIHLPWKLDCVYEQLIRQHDLPIPSITSIGRPLD